MAMREYDLWVRVKDSKSSQQQHIKIEATTLHEARQKAINMGYEVISIN
ncbi:MAG: hypothetical protein NC311_14995 [Muribaculaceae bacterium]|nr:hypothetical protein [Muribaculaceae bacterium]